MTMKCTVTIVLIFLALMGILDLWGDTNARSRIALLCAIKEGQGFRIDGYESWTIDWAKTPDGHYYSNKAPGAAFIALPAFWAIDAFYTGAIPDRTQRDRIRLLKSEQISHWLSFFLQGIPFATLFLWGLHLLKGLGATQTAQHFFAIAFLFGTTATLFMNSYFGHGLAAVFATALVLSILERRWILAGTFFGWGVLTDYGSALLLPGTLWLLVRMEKEWLRSSIWKFLLGGIIPGLMWVIYHVYCFESPFTLPNRFQNPLFVDSYQSEALWGIFGVYPKPSALFGLLLGPTRGILFTQPWVLLALFFLPALVTSNSLMLCRITLFLGLGFSLLLIMNASFLNWHAGGSPGPRYLCAILPSFALISALLMDRRPPRVSIALWLGLMVALAFNSLVFASHRLLNPETGFVWGFFFREIFFNDAKMPILRFGIYWILMGLGTAAMIKEKKA